jgi:hypothetical protein
VYWRIALSLSGLLWWVIKITDKFETFVPYSRARTGAALQIFTTLLTKLGCMTSNEIKFSQLKEQVKEVFDITMLSVAKTVLPVGSMIGEWNMNMDHKFNDN